MPQLNTGAWPPEAEMLGKKLACWLDAPGNPQQSTWLSTQKPRVFSWMSMILGMSDDYWDSWSYPIISFLNLIPSFHLNILWPLELNGCWPLSGVPSPFHPSGNLETWLGLGEDLLWVALFYIYIYVFSMANCEFTGGFTWWPSACREAMWSVLRPLRPIRPIRLQIKVGSMEERNIDSLF